MCLNREDCYCDEGWADERNEMVAILQARGYDTDAMSESAMWEEYGEMLAEVR